jgi:hypothetical protein
MTGDRIEGGCRCGAVRYRLASSQLPRVYACHCLDCQTWSGSAFSLNAALVESLFSVSGRTQLFELAAPGSDRVSRQHACPTCMTRVFNTNSARPGRVVIRAGTLDRSDELRIVCHIWAKRKVAGIELAPGVPSWPESAPAETFFELVLNQA